MRCTSQVFDPAVWRCLQQKHLIFNFFFSFYYATFQCGRCNAFIFLPQKVEKNTQKLLRNTQFFVTHSCQNGPNRRFHFPKCGLQSNCTYIELRLLGGRGGYQLIFILSFSWVHPGSIAKFIDNKYLLYFSDTPASISFHPRRIPNLL